MNATKILVPLHEDDVAPRFDLATEVLIVSKKGKTISKNKRIVALPRASAEQVCQLATTEGIDVVICGGIEETYYQYLIWKRIQVIDSVAGSSQSALKKFAAGDLQPGAIL
ncbi:MAG: hypothetical protein K9L59_02770 [Desulfobacterales bacterium]|nr:hypothetical protein [Desulfobacterales bacterium]MCF8078693.1 hypothetical protein [Desulfobacterales bacterium]